MKNRLLLFGAILFALRSALAAAPAPFELRAGDRVVFLGDTLMEREQQFGWMELMLTTHFPERNVTFRNLGWSADTPAGDSRCGLSLLQAGYEPEDEGWRQLVKQLEDAKPTVVLIGYGMASSFAGEAGLPKFNADYNRLLDTLQRISPGVRCVLLGPIQHESPLPGSGPSASGSIGTGTEAARHNKQLERYSQAIEEIAAARQFPFISLRDAAWPRGPLTSDGIHLSDRGYRAAAQVIERGLGWKSGRWQNSPRSENLRQAIRRKNEWFFHRSRPANMAYIFGFRKGEQGQNAVEIPQFDGLIAAEEQRIAQLRSLQPEVSVPEIPRRVGNLKAKHTVQPHPSFEVADGFEISLYAENPQLDKPIEMNFDPQGRLWVSTSEVYPQIEPGQAATDKIVILEDTRGEGKADKATVFADGLLIPTGLEPGDGGCYVGQSTELLFLKDTQGTGRADLRRTVLSGFGTEDVHHDLHTLRWGFDGRLYMNQSIYTRTDTETPNGVVRLKGGGVFRFDPRDQQMDVLFQGWVNPWGHQFDEFGQSFLTDGAGGSGISFGLPGASYETAPRARRILGSVSPGSYPKFCSLEIIRSGQFPADWQGDLVTCDFRAHRVVRFKIADQGAGYVTQEMPDLLRSTNETFRPVDLKLGPDGALYIADWSNPIINHGEVDFRDPRRDKEHGRIWRVTAKGRPLLPRVDFTKLKNAELLERLISANSYAARSAKRVLVERGARKVVKDLEAWTKRQDSEGALLNALWTYEAFNQTPPALLHRLLAANDARVRAAAVRVVNYSPALAAGELGALSKLVGDENPRVRLEAVRALGKIKTVEAASAALGVLNRPMDPMLDYALWLTVNELAEPWLAALKSGAWDMAGRENQVEFGLKAIEPQQAGEVLGQILARAGIPRDGAGPWIDLVGSAGGPKELRLLFDQVIHGGFDEPAALRAYAALGNAARLRGVQPAGDLTGLGPSLTGAGVKSRAAALQLAGAWKLAAFRPQLLQTAGEATAIPEVRSAAFSALHEIGGAETIADLKKLVAATAAPDVRREAVTALAGLDFSAALPDVIATLQATTAAADAQALWRALLGIKGAGTALAAELDKTRLPPEVANAGLQPAREGNQNGALVDALLRQAGSIPAGGELGDAELKALAAEALAKGDPARGELIYRRPAMSCVVCHAIGGAGGKVGPDLTSLGASAPADYILESVLYPNRKIKEGFHSVDITTKDDEEFTGIVARESDTEVVLRDATNRERSVPKQNIAKRVSGGSLMPGGLMDALPPEERFDLVKFLSMLGRPGEYDAAKAGVPRGWRVCRSGAPPPLPGSEPGAPGDPARKGWKPVLAHVNGALTKADLTAALAREPQVGGTFAATQFNAAKAMPAGFSLTGNIVKAWLNGQPIEAAASFTAGVRPGVNVLVLQLDDGNLPEVLRVASDDVSFLPN